MYTARFVKNGNTKLGKKIYTFNKLAGSGVLGGCLGTCGEYCKGCYNPDNPFKSECYCFGAYRRYSTVVQAHIRNTMAIRENPDFAFKELSEQLKRCRVRPTAVRIHSSGELEKSLELVHWFDIAKENPDVPFYIYTKAFDVVEEAFEEYGVANIPNNFYINISIWHENGVETYKKWQHLSCVRAFIYDDGFKYGDDLKIACHCPAYNEKGKMNHDYTCDKCKICFQSKAKVCACHSH